MGFLSECRTLIDGQSYVLRATDSRETLRNGVDFLEELLETLESYNVEKSETKAGQVAALSEEVARLLDEANRRLQPFAQRPRDVEPVPVPTLYTYVAYGIGVLSLFVYAYILSNGASTRHRTEL
jgi:hypothetical protein